MTFFPNRRLAVLTLSALLLIAPSGRGAQTLVPSGSIWKYLDTGTDQGTAWRQPAFNDSSWPSGPARLGYGDGDEATVVGFGPDVSNKYITTCFRQAFNVADASIMSSLTLRVQRDDGVVVYFHGVEVFRNNLPAR